MANSGVPWKLTLLLLISRWVPGLNAQDFRCYESPEGCTGTSFQMVNTPRDCCLSANGLFYDSPGQPQCATCFVFGWLDAPLFTAAEQAEGYSLQVGYLKGGNSSAAARLQFNVISTEGSAVARDFLVGGTNPQPEPGLPAAVTVILRVDGIALEPDETFQLRLVPENEASMPTAFNEFLIDTLDVTIIDQDDVSVQFTELEYVSVEDEQVAQVTVRRNQLIATPVTLRITPINYTEYVGSGLPDLPAVPEFDPLAPNRAKSFPLERRDFDLSPIEVTFETNEFTIDDAVSQISVFDDKINEADEFFVVVLEIVDAVNPTRVDTSGQNASLCKILDNDPIRIGFEFPTYTFAEEGGSFLNDMFLIKEGGRVSEQTFIVSVTTSAPAQSQLPNAERGFDYTIGIQPRMIRFTPDQQRTPFQLAFFDDDVPEGSEVFELLSSNNAIAQFSSGDNPSTVVIIEDNDGAFKCYTTAHGCAGDFQMEKNRRDCCLGDGLFYELEGVENCTQCVVFGWLDAPEFIGIEQQEAYSLEISYIKGRDTRAGTLQFSVEVQAMTAVEGSSNDFTVTNTSASQNNSQMLNVAFHKDGIALEPNETFRLLLTPENDASMPTAFNEFLVDTLDLTITDQDRVAFQFTAANYSSPEEEGQVQVVVERNQRIATPVTLKVTALNISELLESGIPLLPSLPEFDPGRATSFPEEQRDFDTTPVKLKFEPGGDFIAVILIPIIDDGVNEAEESFAILLEVVDAMNTEKVDISGQNISLCKIVDNDLVSNGVSPAAIRIGFESASYTTAEEDGTRDIFLIKEDNQTSEQTFLVLITAGPGGLSQVPDATLGEDYTGVELTVVRFSPDLQCALVQLTIVDDDVAEETEVFQLELGIIDEGIPFLPGNNPIATVFIKDNDHENITSTEEADSGEDDVVLIGGVVGGVVGFMVLTTVLIIVCILAFMLKNRQELQPSYSFNYSQTGSVSYY